MDPKRTLLIAGAALLAGVAAGYLLFAGGGGASPETGEAAAEAGDGETWYTCGMHPEVLSPTPGDCPQCGMKLTPLKMDGEAGEAAAGKGKKRKILYWVAPMDPGYVSDKPGKSPMGMDLVPVYEDEVRGGSTVRIDPVTEQNMGLRTAKVTRGPLVREVRAVGTVAWDERKLGVVTLKVGGYLEKLHVDETGVMVKKGDPLFDMYSPVVVQAQDELLRTKANRDRASGEERERWEKLFVQARDKLLRWDLTGDQVDEILARGAARKVMTWRSPVTGIVTLKNAVEGDFFPAGRPLYRIAGLDTVWVYVSIYEYEFPWVKVGQEARMELPYFPGRTFRGKVDFVYPYLDRKTRDRRVRLVFENLDRALLPDMYATVIIEARLPGEAVLVPSEAVLDTGRRQVVFVARGRGKFDPRDVRAGVEVAGGLREIRKGLVPGERVVVSGQFLLDSESRIREAIRKMLDARRRKGAAGKASTPAARDHGARPPPGAGTAPGPATPPVFTAPEGLVPIAGKACPVMGNPPDPDVFVDYRGYRIFFCCPACRKEFRAEPGKYIEKLRAQGFEIRLKD